MALILRNRAGRLLRLRGAVVGSWLHSHLSTSTMLPQTSKSSNDHDTKIYELRTYYVKPKAFGKGTTVLTTTNYLRGLTEARVTYLGEVSTLWREEVRGVPGGRGGSW